MVLAVGYFELYPMCLRGANGGISTGSTALGVTGTARHQQYHKNSRPRWKVNWLTSETLPTIGSRRLIREFDLRIGHNDSECIQREHLG